MSEGTKDDRQLELTLVAPSECDRDPVDSLLRRLRDAGASIDRLVLTENRRTMISWSGGARRTLRIHRRFADAEPAVVGAVARFVEARRATERAGALREIRAFLRGFPAAPPTPRRRRVRAEDTPHIRRLEFEFRRVNERFFGGELPGVPILLSGRMRRRNGHFSRRPLEIVISRALCCDAMPGEAEHTLRHEMIHLWQHHTGSALGHGPEFRQWARRLDVHPRARRGVRWKVEPA